MFNNKVIPIIRPFIDRDLDQLKRIEKTSFVDYPWNSEDFAFFLRKLGKGHEAYIAEINETIIGFMLVVKSEWNYKIISIAISPEFRRQGVGTYLIDYIKDRLIPYSREDIYANVRETNKSGIRFFEDQGFIILDTVSNCYDCTDEKCINMKYELKELPLKKEYLGI
jgi:ribosomal protein S18 acetylase RimI-like enzyme